MYDRFFFFRMSRQLGDFPQTLQPVHCVKVGVGKVDVGAFRWAEGRAVMDHMVCGLVGVTTGTRC